MEEARIKMVGDVTWAKENVVSGILRLVRENGLFSTFGGLPAMLAKQVRRRLHLSSASLWFLHRNISHVSILLGAVHDE